MEGWGGSAAAARVALRISDPACVPGAEGERDGDRTEEGEEEEEEEEERL